MIISFYGQLKRSNYQNWSHSGPAYTMTRGAIQNTFPNVSAQLQLDVCTLAHLFFCSSCQLYMLCISRPITVWPCAMRVVQGQL